MRFDIPYSKGFMKIEVPDRSLLGVLEPEAAGGGFRGDSERDLALQRERVVRALAVPVGTPLLRDLCIGKRTATVVTSDHTRPLPSGITLPLLLREMRVAEPELDITILVATGMHRATTLEELTSRFGVEFMARERVVVHDSRDETQLISLGRLPSGGELRVNRLAVETDLLLAEGFIEPHFFAGFSGGRKSILPGVAGYRTVLANHCAAFIDDPRARTGILEGNPIHRDMLFAADAASLSFILNVTLDGQKRITAAFAGDPVEAHRAGCRQVAGQAAVKRPARAPIVVTSNGGYPLDQNVYQAVKGMTAGEALCQDGGVIIMIAGCEGGHGGEGFYESLAGAATPAELLERVRKVPMEATLPDQWEYQILARILQRFDVILVTDLCDGQMIRDMHLGWSPDFDGALRMARAKVGPEAGVLVVPDGVSVIVR